MCQEIKEKVVRIVLKVFLGKKQKQKLPYLDNGFVLVARTRRESF